MILRQFLHTDPVTAASYIIGCGGKSACVVDPVDPPDQYHRAAAAPGIQIRYVVDTHVHADHLPTGRALAALAGAPYVLHETVAAEYKFQRAHCFRAPSGSGRCRIT